MTQTKAMLNQKKIRLIKYVSISLVMISFSCLIAIFDPLEMLIENQLTMRPGSFIYYMWEKPPLAVIMQLYLFNITNADAFLSGVDKKLKVVEVGPYVYQEFLENKNATFNKNGTLSFVPSRHTMPIPERSVGDPRKDIVIAANLPLLGLSSAATKISPFASLAVSSIVKTTNSQPILNLTVHDFLWGYEDNLVRLANTFLPNYITFERFGLMERLFDEGHNVVTMNLPKATENAKKKQQPELKITEDLPVSSARVSVQVPDVEYEDDYVELPFNGIESLAQQTLPKPTDPGVRDYSIDVWNGSPGLKHWGFDDTHTEGNSPCNTLQGVYDGTLFPRNISKAEKYKVYRKAFCRTLPIEYSHSGTEYGVDAYWFKLTDNAFDDSLSDPETMCYCSKEKTCMKKGLGNITPCYYNIPASVSLPHFYNSDPSLVHEVEGINPVKEKHETIIIMQPRLGVPVKVYTRMQVNLMNGETKFNSNVKAFDHLTLPVFWIEIAIEKLTPALDVILYMAFTALPVAQNIIVCLLMLAGISCLAVTLFSCFCLNVSLEQSKMKFNRRKSIKYTAVFPYLKREIAKFEERVENV